MSLNGVDPTAVWRQAVRAELGTCTRPGCGLMLTRLRRPRPNGRREVCVRCDVAGIARAGAPAMVSAAR